MGFMRKDILTSALPGGYTFTRSQTGSISSHINSSGVLTFTAANIARFDHDVTTFAPLGLLLEESRTNYALHSRDFTNAAWLSLLGAADGTTSSVNGETGRRIALGGTAPADFDSRSALYQTFGAAFAGNGNYNASIRWAAMTTARTAAIGIAAASGPTRVNTGNVSLSTSAWTRSAVAINANWSSPGNNISMRPAQGLTSEEVVVSAMDLQQGTFATSHILTTTAAVTRGIDICQITTPPVDTTLPFAMLVKYSLLTGASAGGPLVYDNDSALSAISTGSETCCVVRFDGTSDFDYTAAAAVVNAGVYDPQNVNLYLGGNGTSTALNGCISEVQWWQGAMSDSLMISSATRQAFPMGQAVFDSPFKSPFQPSFSSNIYT